MALTSGKTMEFTFVFAVPLGVTDQKFIDMVQDGMSMSAKLMQHARGAVANVVPEQPAPPNLSL